MTGLDAALVFLVVLGGVTALLAIAEAWWRRVDRKAAEALAAREAAAIRAHNDSLWFDVDEIEWRSYTDWRPAA